MDSSRSSHHDARISTLALSIVTLAALLALPTQALGCDKATSIEGVYDCAGECIVTDFAGNRSVVEVTGETDTVERFPNAKTALYQVSIEGAGGFRELEIGALEGKTLRTATAEVTNAQFPVLEEDVFDTDAACQAVGFTKIVRNPTADRFKACNIYCKKR